MTILLLNCFAFFLLNFIDFKNKTVNYFTSKKWNLFRNSRGMAIQDKQAIAKVIGKSNKGEECYFVEQKEAVGRS